MGVGTHRAQLPLPHVRHRPGDHRIRVLRERLHVQRDQIAAGNAVGVQEDDDIVSARDRLGCPAVACPGEVRVAAAGIGAGTVLPAVDGHHVALRHCFHQDVTVGEGDCDVVGALGREIDLVAQVADAVSIGERH